MDVDITYGKEKIPVKIPEPCEILIPNNIQVGDENKIIKEALENPIGMAPFKEFVKSSEHLLIIVNDASKPTPTSRVLEHIYPFISKHPDVRFLIAVGTHKPPNEEECHFIFGRFYDIFRNRIFVHDSKKEEDMKYLGRTKSGTELYINKMVTDTKNVIVIGSVEPHYFAGYTGGRKAFFPGVAAYKTVEMNHKFALSEKACSLRLKGNPINEDMIESIRLLKEVNTFSIQTVLTQDYKIYAAKCGDIIRSFEQTIKYANDVYCVPIRKKSNIILTVVPYPMDINLYQSQHALENAKLALDEGGIIILVSKCRMGVGNDAFLELLSKADTTEDVLELVGGEYKLGSHKSVRILNIKSRFEVFAVTDLDDDIIRKAKFKPYSDIQTAIDDAVKLVKEPSIIVIPSGNLTVPLFQ